MRHRPLPRWIPLLLAGFVLGMVADWIAGAVVSRLASRQPADQIVVPPAPVVEKVQSRPDPDAPDDPQTRVTAALPTDAVEDLSERSLRLPIDGADVDAMKGQFNQGRSGNTRTHEAVDILAPRGTPIRAVEDGTIAKLFESKAGGTTIYQFDPHGRYCYYYAHLDRYAPHLREGQVVRSGEIIGYVGTTGNAPPNTPHLHFAIFELTSERQWWKGKAIDPYLLSWG